MQECARSEYTANRTIVICSGSCRKVDVFLEVGTEVPGIVSAPRVANSGSCFSVLEMLDPTVTMASISYIWVCSA